MSRLKRKHAWLQRRAASTSEIGQAWSLLPWSYNSLWQFARHQVWASRGVFISGPDTKMGRFLAQDNHKMAPLSEVSVCWVQVSIESRFWRF